MKNLKEAKGKTIQSVETIEAEYGRTYSRYTFICFTDGSKIAITGDSVEPHNPKYILTEMSKAPNFFSVEDIAKRAAEIEKQKRELAKREEDIERYKYEQLKAKFEEK